MAFITRDEWGAEPPKKVAPLTDPEGIGVYWEAKAPSDCAAYLRGIQERDSRRTADIKYSWVICGGDIYEGRGWGLSTWGNNPRTRNAQYHTVLLLGKITEETKKALDSLVKEAGDLGGSNQLVAFTDELNVRNLKPAPKPKKKPEPEPVAEEPVVEVAPDPELELPSDPE